MQIELLEAVENHAKSILKDLPEQYCYHNLSHTNYVVNAAKMIGEGEELSEKDLEKVMIAAWFHDIGYSFGSEAHEDRGMAMAREFLEEKGVSDKKIEKIVGCINATKMPQSPKNLIEMVMCDADLSHLAADDFLFKTEDLREEVCSLKQEMSKKKWLKATLSFMQSHQYFTAYAKKIYNPKKLENIEKVKDRLAQLKEEKEKMTEPTSKDEVKKRPDRGVETMFRLTSSNHFQLSAMADNKANIMISVNTIIVSLIISILIRKLEELPNLIIPTIMLTVVCLIATIFAILATRPNITSGRFSKEDITNKTANLLFFGNFHKMDLHDYEEGMKEMMNDSEFLYSSMTKDIYFLGKVLGKKYEMLRISYNIFMFGFVASVLAFGIAMLFAPSVK